MRATKEQLTPREIEEFNQEKEIAEMQAQFQLEYRKLELQIKRIETRWTQLFRLPVALVLLPVRILFGFGYIAHAIRGTQPSDKFWDFLYKY